MVRRLTQTKWYNYINAFTAKDEWAFELDGLDFRVVNHWIGPTKLLVGDTVLAQRQAAFETTGKTPFLQVTYKTNETTERVIAVYVKAILTVNIRVEIDGRSISNESV